MRNWLAAILVFLHAGLSLSGCQPVFPDASGDTIVFIGDDGQAETQHPVPPASQKDPISESTEMPESGEADPDYCSRHALLVHTGLHDYSVPLHSAEHRSGIPCAVSGDVHTPPPEMMG